MKTNDYFFDLLKGKSLLTCLLLTFSFAFNQLHAQCSPFETDLWTNGGLETGDFTAWTPVDCAGGPFIANQVVCVPTTAGFGFNTITPLEGSCMIYNGFDGGGPCNIENYQEVTIHSGSSATLNWNFFASWDLVTFAPPDAIDRLFEVQVQPAGGGAPLAILFTFSAPAGTIESGTGWIPGSADLSPWAGQTVRIVFCEFIPQPSTGPAQLAIDGVSLCATNFSIPAIGEWGLIILLLLILSFGTAVLMRRQTVLETGGSTASFSFREMPFNSSVFNRVLAAVLASLAIIFSTALLGFGYEMTSADIPGSLIAVPILAYFFHLFFAKSE